MDALCTSGIKGLTEVKQRAEGGQKRNGTWAQQLLLWTFSGHSPNSYFAWGVRDTDMKDTILVTKESKERFTRTQAIIKQLKKI